MLEILECQKNFTFMPVDTKSNPADLRSRGGVTTKQLLKGTLWFNGTEWLTDDGQWPEQNPCITNTTCYEVQTKSNEQTSILDPTRFSSLGKLLRVTTCVISFVKNIMSKGWNKISTTCPLTFWVRMVQNETYQNELRVLQSSSFNDPDRPPLELSKKTLRGNKTNLPTSELSKKTPNNNKKLVTELSTKTLRYRLINQLGLFLDEDYIHRCRCRLQNSSLSYGVRPHSVTQTSLDYGPGHYGCTSEHIAWRSSRYSYTHQEEFLDTPGKTDCQINHQEVHHMLSIRR